MNHKVLLNQVPLGHQAQLPDITEAYSVNLHHPVMLDEGVGIKILGPHDLGKKIRVLDGVYATVTLALPNETTVVV